MNQGAASETPQQITRRWILRFGLLFFFCIVALIALFVIWRIRLSNRIARTLAAVHSAGYPVSLAELEQQYYPIISSNENAAPFFQSAFASLHVTNAGKNKMPDLPDYQSTNTPKFYSEKSLARVTEFLAQNGDALNLLGQSPPATNCRYPIKLSLGVDALLPHLSPLKESAQLLSLAAVIHVRNGDTAAGMDDLTAILRLARSLDREPVVISQLVRISAEMMAVRSLEHILNSQPLSDPRLVRLSAAFRDPENSSALERAVAGDLCTGSHIFKTFGAEMNKAVSNNNPGNANGSSPPAVASSTAYGFLKLTGFFDRDYCFYLETMAENLRIARLPALEKLDAATKLGNRVEQETSHHNYLISSLILPAFNRAYVRQIGLDASINIVQTVLAIERYRLAHQNQLPDKLSDLVPSCLDTVPVDPFDGQPLRYKKLTKGYMVYSIGEDRKDDGGVYAYRPKPGAPLDITFVVER
jgi:hypothetical protein